MKYYKIHCETPYCGEDNYYYIKTDDENKLRDYAADCCMDNAAQWADEDQVAEDYPDIEDYYAECTYVITEITKEEYEDECPWDKED
jgi:hypothetical protein